MQRVDLRARAERDDDVDNSTIGTDALEKRSCILIVRFARAECRERK
jgi:hypothetical protein